MTKDRLQKFMTEELDQYDTTSQIGFTRNKMLIDFACIPKDLHDRIIYTYENIKPAPRAKLLDYFIAMKLKNLMEVIEDF
jgi:hypothetical protein